MENMTEHLYNSKLGKIKWFVKRFGFSQLFMKPLRMIFAPIIILFIRGNNFFFNGEEYSLFYHKYNVTWSNEREVEVPLIKRLTNNFKGEILEVGNVLSHYYNVDWDILDKFEKGERIINEDAINFKPAKKYDLIISISTMEHIGYDDEYSTNSAEKIMESFHNLIDNCLNKGGTLVMTVPIDYNPDMDKLIASDKFNFNKHGFLIRRSKNSWKEVNKEEALKSKYGKPFPYANCILVGEYKKKE